MDRLHRNLYVILKFTKQSKTTRIIFLKCSLLWRGWTTCSWFSCRFGQSWDWYAADYKDMELKMNYLPPKIMLQKVCSFKWQFCTKVCPYLHGWSPNFRDIRAIYRDTVPDISHSNQNIETSCKSKLKLTKLKDLHIKSLDELVKDKWFQNFDFQ